MDSVLSLEVPGTETDLKKILGTRSAARLGDSFVAMSYPRRCAKTQGDFVLCLTTISPAFT